MKYLALLLTLAATTMATMASAQTIWDRDAVNDVEVIRIAADPADAPSPLLKYRFDLKPSQTTPGNAAADYRRAFAENGTRGAWEAARQMYPGDQIDGEPLAERLYDSDTPLHKLPKDKIAKVSQKFDSVIQNYVGPGTSRRRCDWELPTLDLKGPDLIAMLLPDIQGMRSLSRAVCLQTRAALVERRYDDAIDLMRINYTMGRDTGREPLLVCDLVGIAICGMASNTVLDLIGSPDSPNMYWALTNLPTPLVPIRRAIEVEMEIGKRTLPFLLDVENANWSYDEWNARWKRGARVFDENHLWMDEDELPRGIELTPMLFGVASYTHAKSRMVGWGYDTDAVEAMPVGQVLALYSSRVYQDIADKMEVAQSLPYPESRAIYDEADRDLQQRGPYSNHPDRELIPLASLLLPAVGASRDAEVRLDRTIAALRVIEALRMHAARNDGELPKSLGDVTCVPIPKNPATDKGFVYNLEQIDGKATAVLTLPRSDGITQSYRYELTMQ